MKEFNDEKNEVKPLASVTPKPAVRPRPQKLNNENNDTSPIPPHPKPRPRPGYPSSDISTNSEFVGGHQAIKSYFTVSKKTNSGKPDLVEPKPIIFRANAAPVARPPHNTSPPALNMMKQDANTEEPAKRSEFLVGIQAKQVTKTVRPPHITSQSSFNQKQHNLTQEPAKRLGFSVGIQAKQVTKPLVKEPSAAYSTKESLVDVDPFEWFRVQPTTFGQVRQQQSTLEQARQKQPTLDQERQNQSTVEQVKPKHQNQQPVNTSVLDKVNAFLNPNSPVLFPPPPTALTQEGEKGEEESSDNESVASSGMRLFLIKFSDVSEGN